MPPTSPYPSSARPSTVAWRSSTSKQTLRRPSSLAIALGDPGSGSGRAKLESSIAVPPPGGRSMTICVRESGMPITVSMNSPSTNMLPSTSRPRPTKKAVTESRSATVIPTWSNLMRAMTAILRCSSGLWWAKPPSVVHRFDPELGQLGHALAHVPNQLRRRTLPARDLLDDPQWLRRPVGPGRVPGEALVGHVRVVLDRAEWLDPIHPSGPVAASELGGQWCPLARGRQVDVSGLTPRAVVRAPARREQVTRTQVGPGPVEERPGVVYHARRRRWIPQQAVEPFHEDR